MTDTFLTPEGLTKLRAELENLLKVKRPELSRRLREAIQMGDLSENADYIMAKEDQAFLEGKINELEALLRSAVVIDPEQTGSAPEVVGLGRTVTAQEPGVPVETFILVGAKEADPRQRKISNESPIGKALMGKRVGDTAVAETPAGEIKFKILKIE